MSTHGHHRIEICRELSGKLDYFFPCDRRTVGRHDHRSICSRFRCDEDGAGGRASGLNRSNSQLVFAEQPIDGPKLGNALNGLAYPERVSERTRGDCERIMLLFADWRTKKRDRIGDRPLNAMTPVAADKVYALIAEGRPRRGEKLIALCGQAWNVVHRRRPDEFDRDVPNP